jgi:transcriptional regulator with XRE-family HTH domain
MATTLAPVDSREVVRCDRCLLVQFRTMSGSCRKCKTALDEEPEPEPIPVIAPPPIAEPRNGHLQVATSIRSLRQRSGLSQRQLALRMKVPRTYVSKIENEKATPTLSSLERLANALEVSVPELLAGGCTREREIREWNAVVKFADAGEGAHHASAPTVVNGRKAAPPTPAGRGFRAPAVCFGRICHGL